MEEYKGVKFQTIDIERKVHDRIKLVRLDRTIAEFIKTNLNEGNMSIREKSGFLIKKAGSKMTQLNEKDVVYVKKIKENKVFSIGGIPSSESIMHWEIYQKRKDIKIILHFHDNSLLGNDGIGPFEYGTEELAEAVARESKEKDIIKIKEHGLVIITDNEKDLIRKLKGLYGRT